MKRCLSLVLGVSAISLLTSYGLAKEQVVKSMRTLRIKLGVIIEQICLR